MKLVIFGFGRHGKDSVSEILHRDYGMTFESSSHFFAVRDGMKAMAARGLVYDTFDQMYADRVNHRAAWHDAILAYNTPDLTRLGRGLFAAHDIYCGIREEKELRALQETGVIDFTIWVDASKRLPPEDSASCTVTPDMADYILDNNGRLADLPYQVFRAMQAAKWAHAAKVA